MSKSMKKCNFINIGIGIISIILLVLLIHYYFGNHNKESHHSYKEHFVCFTSRHIEPFVSCKAIKPPANDK